MTTMKAQLSSIELEARYKAAADPISKSHFHALWLLSCGYEVEEVAELLLRLGALGAGADQTLQRGRSADTRRPACAQRNEADDPHACGVSFAERADQDAAR